MQPSSPSSPKATPHSRTVVALTIGAIALAVALGGMLRLTDPLSSPVVPAEDPYMHMALVREHLRTGDLDPINAHQNVYPPGLHGFLAAAWVMTGLELYDLVLFGPVLLGVIGILGMALLLWRSCGPVAAFVGALAFALAPEVVFRTTMMSPTALDLAVLPFFLYALLRVLAGRLSWMGVAAPMAVFFALSHPWLLAILGSVGVVFLVTSFVLPWSQARAPPLTVRSVAAGVSILGLGAGIALLTPGFASTLGLPRTDLRLAWIALAIVAQAPLAAVTVARSRRRTWPHRVLHRAQPSTAIRVALSAGIALGVVGLTLAALQGGLPPYVDLLDMVGWPILALAFAGLVALPFLPSPLANLAAALVAVTLPFVLFNPMGSEFLSHRTAVYLGLALALLAGIAAAAAARLAADAWAARSSAADAAAAASPSAKSGAAPHWLRAIGPALLVATLLGGSVYAGTPETYPGGWYRLYTPCELEGLRDVAEQANADPEVVVIAATWQSKLVLAALTDDASRVWYTREVFTSADVRDMHVAQLGKDGHPVLIVLDRHMRTESPDADTAFVSSAPWQPAGAWCSEGLPHPRLTAYTTDSSTGGLP